ncbi:VanZ family protein [Paenisporosarcina sp. FSL H8-0542]|uniref:VanZ family protein n=1 Tax=Paenisporosarcina sp. FSL H8-0542 TaxID=2921401 RepID=UPI00315A6010
MPFASINELLNHFYYMVPLRNILGNIILFTPLGFILILKFKRLNNMMSVVLVGVLSSTFIEIIQLLLPNRSFDIDDIILNTLGTMIGLLILKVTKIEKIFGFTVVQEQTN